MKQYLYLISDFRYRKALTRLRANSNILEIEHGRYTFQQTFVCGRLCRTCNVIHFLLNCVRYVNIRHDFCMNVDNRYDDFTDLNDNEKYSFLMINTDPHILILFGKFICHILPMQQNTVEFSWTGLLVHNCMLLCHNYGTIPICISPENIVSVIFTFHVEILAAVHRHMCAYWA